MKRHPVTVPSQNERARHVIQKDIDADQKARHPEHAKDIGGLHGPWKVVLTVGVIPRKNHREEHLDDDEQGHRARPDRARAEFAHSPGPEAEDQSLHKTQGKAYRHGEPWRHVPEILKQIAYPVKSPGIGDTSGEPSDEKRRPGAQPLDGPEFKKQGKIGQIKAIERRKRQKDTRPPKAGQKDTRPPWHANPGLIRIGKQTSMDPVDRF